MSREKPLQADVIIAGAGIAGLWILNLLKRRGYNALLLETDHIGGGQTIAAQGIIHSGLKYMLAEKMTGPARSLADMPQRWREALAGKGEVDLSAVNVAAGTQHLLIPKGFTGGFLKTMAEKTLGDSVREMAPDLWPLSLKSAGFKGSVLAMNETVLDVPAVIRALAEPYRHCIRKADINDLEAEAEVFIFTAAAGNEKIAKRRGHEKKLKSRARPLLMGMLKPAPFSLFTHLVGASEKPVATVTTHKAADGTLVWYVGGQVAERPGDSNPGDVLQAMKDAFKKYMPGVDLGGMEWAVLPIDRVEGQGGAKAWLPDMPTVRAVDDCLYCWPTKLTFAPMLGDMVMDHLEKNGLQSSCHQSDWSFLPEVDYALPPWDKVKWIKQD
ncbi:MAG: FAD-dependent oxidoreductase [Alphaproteobacteria bacterium]|nr:FAD-dependent oxidoreductase [Alphaproteobacteria bacterium]